LKVKDGYGKRGEQFERSQQAQRHQKHVCRNCSPREGPYPPRGTASGADCADVEDNVIAKPAAPCLVKKTSSFPPSKNQAVLTKLVIGSEFFTKQGAAGFCDDVVFHVGNNLRHCFPRGGLRPFARTAVPTNVLDDVRLLLRSNCSPLLRIHSLPSGSVGKLIAHFEGKKFQQAQPKNHVYLYVFVILGLRQRTLQQLGEQLAKARTVRSS